MNILVLKIIFKENEVLTNDSFNDVIKKRNVS